MVNFDKKRHLIKFLEGLIEVILLALAYYFIWTKMYRSAMGDNGFMYRGKFVLMGLYALVVFVIFHLCDSFNFGNLKLTYILISQVISMILVNIITYFQNCLIANQMLTCIPMLILTGIDIIIVFLCCYIFTSIYHRSYVKRKMLLIYGSDNAQLLSDKFNSRKDKYLITKEIEAGESYEKLIEEICRHDATVLNDVPADKRNKLVKYCFENNKRAYIVPSLSDVILRGSDDLTLFDTPLVLIDGSGPAPEGAFAKRALDLILGAIAFIPCAIVMAIVAVCIKLDDGGSVFYKQNRLTKDGRVFKLYKFRSMIENAEAQTGAIMAREEDPRITKVGNFLRRHRLDEIPQILNILKGEMSIVGPRPERPEIAEEIIKDMPEFKFRTKVKAGLTGYAQVYGKYNTTAYDKLKMDLIYIEKQSLLLDLKLILMTPQILFRKESTEGAKQ